MFQCVAVTVDGFGSVWGFESPEAARRHPIVQPGDPILSDVGDIDRSWSPLHLPIAVSRVLGRDIAEFSRPEYILEALQQGAVAPPTDPAEICRVIVEDRVRYDSSHPLMARRSHSDMTDTKTADAPKAKDAAPKTIAGFAPTAKISLGANKDGKKYDGKDNNPKRAGSKSFDVFAKYKDGMTVEQAVAAGVSAADIKWDSGKGFIKVA